MSEIIIAKVQNYLAGLHKGVGTKVDFPITGKYSETVGRSLKRQFSPDSPREFTLRASNLGRPGCILEAEKYHMPRDNEPYSSRFRNLFGDITEASAVVAMKLAGVNVLSEQGGIQLTIAGITVEGTYDLVVAEPEPKVYDIKSASSFAFKHKFLDKNLQNIVDEGDIFGYVVQLYIYSTALGIPVGGLIVINKEDGSWTLVNPPQDDSSLRLWALSFAQNNIRRLSSNKEFSKDFQPFLESFRKKETGNMLLHSNCSFCSYKKTCWPTAVELPQLASKGVSPRKVWYYSIDPKYNKKEEDGDA